jgi:hypothetical protein
LSRSAFPAMSSLSSLVSSCTSSAPLSTRVCTRPPFVVSGQDPPPNAENLEFPIRPSEASFRIAVVQRWPGPVCVVGGASGVFVRGGGQPRVEPPAGECRARQRAAVSTRAPAHHPFQAFDGQRHRPSHAAHVHTDGEVCLKPRPQLEWHAIAEDVAARRHSDRSPPGDVSVRLDPGTSVAPDARDRRPGRLQCQLDIAERHRTGREHVRQPQPPDPAADAGMDDHPECLAFCHVLREREREQRPSRVGAEWPRDPRLADLVARRVGRLRSGCPRAHPVRRHVARRGRCESDRPRREHGERPQQDARRSLLSSGAELHCNSDPVR